MAVGGPAIRSMMPPWWKWVVLIATIYMGIVVNGYAYCFGLLKIKLAEQYPEKPMWLIAIVGGFVPTLSLFLAPFGLAITEHLGARFATITGMLTCGVCFFLSWLNGIAFQGGFYLDMVLLGVTQGTGAALLYGPSLAVLPDYFDMNQLSLATGITAAGASSGVILYGLFTNPIFDAFGWRGAMLIYGLLCIQGVLAGLAFVPLIPAVKPPKPNATTGDVEMAPLSPSEDNKATEALLPPTNPPLPPPKKTFSQVLRKYFDPKLVCQGPFILLLGAAAFSIMGYFVPTILVPNQARKPEYGVHPIVQKNIMAVYGVSNTLSRVAVGRIGDYGYKSVFFTSWFLFTAGLVIAATASIVFPFTMPLGNVAFIGFVVIYSLSAAPVMALRSMLTINMFGKANASASFGWFLCAQGAVQMLGYILPSYLETMGVVFAYGFAALMYLLAAACCVANGKFYFSIRRKMIDERNAANK